MAKKFLKIFLVSLVIILLGTVLDYFAHETSPRFAVPSYYFRNKIIFGFIWILAASLVSLKFIKSYKIRAVFVSAVVAAALQTRYFFEGYDLFFVFLFMGLHFLMFLLPARLLFKRFSIKT